MAVSSENAAGVCLPDIRMHLNKAVHLFPIFKPTNKVTPLFLTCIKPDTASRPALIFTESMRIFAVFSAKIRKAKEIISYANWKNAALRPMKTYCSTKN